MPQFDNHGLRGGIWRGRITGLAAAPGRVVLIHHGEVLSQARLAADGDDAWLVEVDLPGQVLTEGLQTLLLKADDAEGEEGSRPEGVLLARISVMAGRVLDDDLASEIAALRAELELVKRELRRFAAEQTGR
ncbi:hypothetical protein D3P06_00230 [Paracoccus aestuarii]|uniref:Uncharacterized protein n=1 Tax=Paracoccus aestuarii TaxID=453842 RepID=A0A419A308_9RHOB|nr:hypothetical protein [Paracoccus aestuarii]RJL07534.1 hypothetical protein D3P06_00230 [Paracoccus aestuarii]WCQ99044.1 hypothetical protein JHW48_14560 [Paracoccus aestuarii]